MVGKIFILIEITKMKNFTFIAAVVSGLLCCIFIYVALTGSNAHLIGASFFAGIFVAEMCLYLKLDQDEYRNN
jgi:hypothetical protein